MAQSGLIVTVPQAEGLVGGLRERFDASAQLGVPAHITVLFPFMAPQRIDAAVRARIAAVVGRTAAFQFSLARVGMFPATAYLAPQPAAPFVALTESLVKEFPEFPPFAGAFEAVVPHLTVAHGSPSDAGIARAELAQALAAHGPIVAACDALTLVENSSGRWTTLHVFALAPRGVL